MERAILEVSAKLNIVSDKALPLMIVRLLCTLYKSPKGYQNTAI